uniref:Uncharacterized protein n=1 Tax=Panagrellus redivivus TaxID=6233 RepID=A0A7E4W0F8_PANRE
MSSNASPNTAAACSSSQKQSSTGSDIDRDRVLAGGEEIAADRFPFSLVSLAKACFVTSLVIVSIDPTFANGLVDISLFHPIFPSSISQSSVSVFLP